jgi:hypothetical protein
MLFESIRFKEFTEYSLKVNFPLIDFYNYYDIVDERPDQLSFKLYGDVSYYWTFYLLNDNIRRQGWPVKQVELDAWIKKRYFRTVITTRDSLDNVFPIGSQSMAHYPARYALSIKE